MKYESSLIYQNSCFNLHRCSSRISLTANLLTVSLFTSARTPFLKFLFYSLELQAALNAARERSVELSASLEDEKNRSAFLEVSLETEKEKNDESEKTEKLVAHQLKGALDVIQVPNIC